MAGRPYNIPPGALDGTIYDESNADSLINIVPDRMIPVLQRMKPKIGRVLYQSEGEIRKFVEPDERDERIRLSFWDEYNHSTHVGKKMSLAAFLSGIMSWEAWTSVYEPDDRRMLWVLCPPVSYQVAMRNILQKGTERLMEIMSLPIYDKEGKVDSKVVVNILKAFQLVDIRVKGAVTQKLHIQQQSMNINQNINAESPLQGQSIEMLGLEDLEALEKRIEKARHGSKRLMAQLSQEDKFKVIGEIENEEAYLHGAQSRRLPGIDLDAPLQVDVVTHE